MPACHTLTLTRASRVFAARDTERRKHVSVIRCDRSQCKCYNLTWQPRTHVWRLRMQTGIDRYLSVFGDSHNSGFNEHSRFVLFQFLLVVGCIGGFKGGAVQRWTVIPFQTVRKRFFCVCMCVLLLLIGWVDWQSKSASNQFNVTSSKERFVSLGRLLQSTALGLSVSST